MTIIPTPTPAEHPAWCDREHAEDWKAHHVQIGADLQLAEDLAYSVDVLQAGDRPAEVLLYRHTDDVTISTSLSIVEAGILRDLLSEALAVLGAEVGR